MHHKEPNTDKLQSNAEDLRIIEAILQGETNLYDKIQKKYNKMITAIIKRVVRNENEIQDLVQETHIKAFNALPSYDKKYIFSSWLMKIATNHAIDFLRKKKLETISINNSLRDSDEDDLYIQIPDPDFLPDENLSNKEYHEIFKNLIEKLPENFQKVVLLRFQEDLGYNEIAQKLSLPLGTVKATLFRARKMLAALWLKSNVNK